MSVLCRIPNTVPRIAPATAKAITMATINKTFPILLLTERFFLRFLRFFGFPEEDGRRVPFAPEGRVCLVPEGRVCLTPVLSCASPLLC